MLCPYRPQNIIICLQSRHRCGITSGKLSQDWEWMTQEEVVYAMVAEGSTSAAAVTDAGSTEVKDMHYPTAPLVVAIRSSDDTHVQKAGASRCSKLSRYKVVAPVVVVLVALLLFATSCCARNKQPVSLCPQVGPPEKWPPDRQKNDLLRYSHTRRQMPQCLIIGARKAGTRALLSFIDLHPQVQSATREVHFFDRNYDKGIVWYRRHMPFTFKDQITVEKSPNYFVDPAVPERVYKLNSSMKLLLILRDPIRRTISDYLQIMDNRIKRRKAVIPFEKLVLNQETLEINQSYSAVKRSVYVRHLARWMQFFPLQQIHIVDGENLVLEPWGEMAKVENFLGLEHQITEDKFTFNPEHGFYCYTLGDREQCLAESKGRKHPVIDPFVLKKLKDFFRNFNEKLFMRIGRRFDWN